MCVGNAMNLVSGCACRRAWRALTLTCCADAEGNPCISRPLNWFDRNAFRYDRNTSTVAPYPPPAVNQTIFIQGLSRGLYPYNGAQRVLASTASGAILQGVAYQHPPDVAPSLWFQPHSAHASRWHGSESGVVLVPTSSNSQTTHSFVSPDAVTNTTLTIFDLTHGQMATALPVSSATIARQQKETTVVLVARGRVEVMASPSGSSWGVGAERYPLVCLVSATSGSFSLSAVALLHFFVNRG